MLFLQPKLPLKFELKFEQRGDWCMERVEWTERGREKKREKTGEKARKSCSQSFPQSRKHCSRCSKAGAESQSTPVASALMVTLISTFLIGSLTVTSRTGPDGNNKTEFGCKVTSVIHVLFGCYTECECNYCCNSLRNELLFLNLVIFIQCATKTLVLPIYIVKVGHFNKK